MRIADADCHISSERRGIRITAEELVASMDANGVEKSLVWLHPGQSRDEYCDYDAGNEYVSRAAREHGSRLYPVGWLNPTLLPREKLADYAKRLKYDWGFSVVKLNGAQNFFDILDEKLSLPTVEELAKLGLTLAFHSGNDMNTRPEKVANIASRFPETPILLVHMGQTLNDEAIEAAAAHGNISLVGSGMGDYTYVRKAVERLGSRRVLFGSDAPFAKTGDILAEYDRSLAPFGESELADVMGMNLMRFIASADERAAAAR